MLSLCTGVGHRLLGRKLDGNAGVVSKGRSVGKKRESVTGMCYGKA